MGGRLGRMDKEEGVSSKRVRHVARRRKGVQLAAGPDRGGIGSMAQIRAQARGGGTGGGWLLGRCFGLAREE
jgi:hypothetical protein